MGFSVVEQSHKRRSSSLPSMGKRRDRDEGGGREQAEPLKKRREAPPREKESPRAQEEARPLGEVIGVERKGKGLKKHYAGFEFDGLEYELEETVLMRPDDGQKPYVAIIKGITEDTYGNVMVTGQWFYRPEEAKRREGGHWEARDSRELFFSYHVDEVPAESVMHKCTVHFVPLNKQLPVRSQHPGFIVQKIYDIDQKKLWDLTDQDYEDEKQHEIDLLIQKTRKRIGELPDLQVEYASAAESNYLKTKKNLGRDSMNPVDISRAEPTTRLENLSKAYRSGVSDVSKYHAILSKFEALTGDEYRDKWLEKLLLVSESVCQPKDDLPMDDNQKGNIPSSNLTVLGKNSALSPGALGKDANDLRSGWPDAVVPVISALERVTYESFVTDRKMRQYHQKMRQFEFNIKNSAVLARRLLNKELEPIALITMTPDELKEGLTAHERMNTEPEKEKQIQMTETRCTWCKEKQVGVTSVIRAGRRDRYELECVACGHNWYASPDDISSMSSDSPNVGNVGTAPLATAKFEAIEKNLASPRKSQADALKKSEDAYFPVLEAQKSFSKSRAGYSSPASKR